MASPILLTPGPLTTDLLTREAMLKDWGSWDFAFSELTSSVCQDITRIALGEGSHVCVPLQGSGSFAVEAALGTLVPRHGKVLVPQNGAYAQRIVKILKYLGRSAVVLDHKEEEPIDPERVATALQADPAITHVALVHCETGTGILNPLAQIASVVAAHGRGLIVDAMSSFGAIPIDLRDTPMDALIAASGKCLEGVPGMGFVLIDQAKLLAATDNSHSLVLDLRDQWLYMQRTGQWRFTPPTHVVAALRSAIDQFISEGGVAGRGARYRQNLTVLVKGLRSLGLQPFLTEAHQSPIIVTFHAPSSPAYQFADFYRTVRAKGFILYPGKLTVLETFRVGCIGAIGPQEMARAVQAITQSLQELGIEHSAFMKKND